VYAVGLALVFTLQQPEKEKHHEDANACKAEKQGCQRLLCRLKEQHAQCDEQVYHVNENQGGDSFVHRVVFTGPNIENYFETAHIG
jgi:hypothetical protein